MITIGYGDIIPVNNQEKVFVMFMSIFSTAFFGYSIQKISEIFGDIVSKRKKLENQKYAVQKYLNDRVENELLLHKIVDNLEQSFKNNDDVIQLGQSIIEKIDQNLNMEFKQEFFGKIIQNFKPFQMNFSKQTLELLSQHMFEKIIEKDQVIFQKGQLSENLFMLVKGEIQIYNQKPQTNVIYQLGNIKKGKFFGVNPFIADLSYEYSTKAKTDCHIIYCSKQDFNSIIKQSFQDYENLRKIKDEIIFNNKSFFTGIECLGCGEQDHTIQFCPLLHVQPKKFHTIIKYQYSQEQYERKFQERKYPQKYPSLINQDIVQNIVKKIRLDQLQQIYQHNFNENQVKQLMSSKLDHKQFFTILPIIRQETLKQDYINELKMIHGDHWLNHYNQFKDSEEDQEFSDLNIFGSSMGSSQNSSSESSSNSNSESSSFHQQQNQENLQSDQGLNSVVIEENQSLGSSSNIKDSNNNSKLTTVKLQINSQQQNEDIVEQTNLLQEIKQLSQQFEQGKQEKNKQNEMNISKDLNIKIMNKSDRNVNHNSQQLSNSSANKLSLSKSISQKQIQSQEYEKMNLSKSEKKKRKKSNYLNTSNNNNQNQNIDRNVENNFDVITNNDNNQLNIENMENNANKYSFNQNHLVHKNHQIMTDQSQNKDGEKNLNSSYILKKSNQKRQQQKIVKCIVQSVLEKLTGISGTDYFENQDNFINSLNDSFQSNYQTPQNQNNNNSNSNLRHSLNKKNILPDSKRKKTQFKDVLYTRNQLQQSKKLTYIFNDKKINNQMEESKHFKNPALESKIAQNIENQQSRLFQQLRKQSKKLSINSVNEQQQQNQQNKSHFYKQQKEQMHTKNMDILKNNRKTMIKKPTFLANNLAQNLNNNFNNLNYNQNWDQQIQQQQYLMQQQKQQQQQYTIINNNNIDNNNSGFSFQNQNHILKKQNSISLQHQNSIQSYGNLQSVGQLEQMSLNQQQNQQNNNISIKKLNANNAYQNLTYSHQRGTLGNNEINIDLINNDQYLKTRFYYYFIDQPKEFKYYFPHNNQSEVLAKEKQLFQARQLQILIIKKSNMYNSKQGPSTTSHKMKNSYINAKGLQQSYQSNETPQNNVKGMQGSWGSMQSSNKLLKKLKKNKKKVINLDSFGNTIN